MLTIDKSRPTPTVLILGAGGFLGSAVVAAATNAGLTPVGLVRNDAAARQIEGRGGIALRGDAADPESWILTAANAVAVIDLIQPRIPRRLGEAALSRIVVERAATTRALVSALLAIPAERRPLYLNVSGVAELLPDARGLISHESTLTSRPAGFARIGLAARAAVEKSGIEAAFIHLGTVYGPGKSFSERVLPALERGRYPIFGRGENRLALVHVDDAARALVHIAMASPAATRLGSWVVVDESRLTLGEFLTQTASAVGGPKPKRLPRWVGRVLLGSGLIAELSKDVPSDSSRLTSSGFAFAFPRFATGLVNTLETLRARRDA